MFLDINSPPQTPEEALESEIRFLLNVFFPDSQAALEYFLVCEKVKGVEAIKPLRDATRVRWVAKMAARRVTPKAPR